MKNAIKVIIAFVIGQLVQLSFQFIVNTIAVKDPVLWTGSAGLIVTGCILVGAVIAWTGISKENKGKHTHSNASFTDLGAFSVFDYDETEEGDIENDT